MSTPFHYDYVGSFLRPQELLEARKKYENKEISDQELEAIENKCIDELISKQKELGYQTITDGEFRRATWHLDFMWGFEGVSHRKTVEGIPFNDEVALIDDTYLTGKLSVKDHPFVKHFKYVKQFEEEGIVAKQTIPSLAQFLFQLIIPQNKRSTLKYYDSIDVLIEDLTKGYHKVIQDLYDAGCRNIQFDDCTWGVLVDPNARFILNTDDKGLEDIKNQLLLVNNKAIEGKPDDLVINTHICRGNFHSTWACQGSYESVQKELFEKENVNAYYLEFDDERSGGFEPLQYVSENKKVVLGLITTKSPVLENKEKIIARIKEASKYIDLDRLYLSPQCGFASCDVGNKLTFEDQWAKLKLVKDIAEEVWKDA